MAPPKVEDPKEPVTCRLPRSIKNDYIQKYGRSYRSVMEQLLVDNAPSVVREREALPADERKRSAALKRARKAALDRKMVEPRFKGKSK